MTQCKISLILLIILWFQVLYGISSVYDRSANSLISYAASRNGDDKRNIRPSLGSSEFFKKFFISQNAIERKKYIKTIKYVWQHFLEPVSPDSLSDCSKGRFLVLRCRNRGGHRCGGLADRERGIISSFLLALQTGRTFAIDMDKPCELEQFLLPNLYNWTRCNSYIQSLPGSETEIIDVHNLRDKYFSLFKEPFTSQLSSPDGPKAVLINTNIAPLQRILSENYIQKRVPWLKDFTIRELVVIIFNTLFVPSDRLIAALDSLQSMQSNHLLQCAHIRYGHSVDMPADPSFATSRGRVNTSHVTSFFIRNAQDRNMDSSVFIATDSSDIHRQMESQHKNYIRLNTTISHIEFSGSCDGFYSAILEQLVLTQCDVLVLSSSGFGSFAAYIRGVDTGLYQYHTNRSKTPDHITSLTIEDDMRSHGYFINY